MSQVKIAYGRPGGLAIPAIAQGTVENVAWTGGATGESAAFDSDTTLVRVVSDVECFIKFGAAPTADGDSTKLPAGVVEFFVVTRLHKVSVYHATNSGTLNVTQAASDNAA